MKPRYLKMKLSPMGISWLHLRNPWMALACSIALPGLGHFYCGAYLRGFLLMSWEITVNHLGRVNQAIFLTLMGHADKAQQVVDYEWVLIYPVFYVLAMWDAYRLCVDLNNRCESEKRQAKRQFEVMALSMMDLTILGKRNPWMALFLSLLLGGGGHFYNFSLVKAVMLMGWHLAIWLNSGMNQAIVAMAKGNWEQVHQVLDYQWLLFFPSIHVFNMWNAYSDTVELNKLYEEEQEYFLHQVTASKEPECREEEAPCVTSRLWF
ncbi:MAG TPA: hypothetical protein VD902_10295 [Symbiobacteriaceae bacterium]|nr:hypothetical protein [Symbiobacteriaceae bacterium]